MTQWSPEALRRDGESVVRWLADFYGGMEERPIVPAISPAGADALFDEPMPRQGRGFEGALAEVRAKIEPNSLLIPHPRYFGLMNPRPVAPAILAEVIVSGLNQNSAAWSHSPAGTAVEKRVIRWFCDLVGYPEEAFGTFCSGGSVANLTGLRLGLVDRFPEAFEDGLHSLSGQPVFYASAEAHYSFGKAAMTLGLGRSGVRPAAVDARARIDVARLREQIGRDREEGKLPFALVATAGTTSAGSIDPLGPLADLAREENLWYHVDAAWGSGILMSSTHRHLLRGIERADSVTFDPHKWLFQPMGSGAILTRHRETLRRAFSSEAVYIPTAEDERVDFRRYTLVGSKRFDALKMWISLKSLGAAWYEEVVDRHMELTRWLLERIEQHPDFEVAVPPDLDILCFRYRPSGAPEDSLPALQDALVDAVLRDNRSWISSTTVRGVRAIRWMALGPSLTRADVERFWATLQELAPAAALPR